MPKELYNTGRQSYPPLFLLYYLGIYLLLLGGFILTNCNTCSLVRQISGCLHLRICLLIWGAHCYAELISLMKANIRCEFL